MARSKQLLGTERQRVKEIIPILASHDVKVGSRHAELLIAEHPDQAIADFAKNYRK
jgi:hypothetical protein